MIALLILVAVICILPVVWVLVSSLKSLDEFYSVPPTLWPKSFHFEAIPELFRQYDFIKLYWNTIKLCAGSIVFSIVINGFMGYSLSKLHVKGGAIVFSIVLATYMIPTTVCMAPVYKNIISFPVLGINLLNTNSDITTNVTKDFKEFDELKAEVKELRELLRNVSSVRSEENKADSPNTETNKEI